MFGGQEDLPLNAAHHGNEDVENFDDLEKL